MKNGIVFIWSEVQILGRLVEAMEKNGFIYIENFVVAFLDTEKSLLEINGKKKTTTNTNNNIKQEINNFTCLQDNKESDNSDTKSPV